MVRLLVPTSARGQRLDRFLAVLADESKHGLTGLSRARVQALVDFGHVRVDGRLVRSSYRLRGVEHVEIEVPPPVPARAEPEFVPLDILFEDEHLIAVNKPTGLVVHPGAGRASGTLVNGLLWHCRDLSGIGGVLRPGIVHRLDRGTSGVLIAAKHDRAHEGLARQFARREVEKNYVAFVRGVPEPRTATLRTAYGRHPTQRLRFTSKVKQGKLAITTYTVVTAACGIAQLGVVLGTGRTHQIRVHLADLGHPIVGDPLYGSKLPLRSSRSEVVRLIELLPAQALHAESLTFVHPITDTVLKLSAPWPQLLRDLRSAMLLPSPQ